MAIEIRLAFDRETKNTVRFAELDGGQPVAGGYVVGTLYVQKTAWAALGQPDTIAVSLEVAAT